MFSHIKGDIFTAEVDAIVNPVNTEGVMGAGLAKVFKSKYPKMFEHYKVMCDSELFETGDLLWWDIRYLNEKHKFIINFPTKREWRKISQYNYIATGLSTFVSTYANYNIQSAAFPLLGCGLGELDKYEVYRIMNNYLGSLPIQCYVYYL